MRRHWRQRRCARLPILFPPAGAGRPL